MISAIRLKSSKVEVDRRRDAKAKRKEKKEQARRVFADLSSGEKDELLKELAIRAGLVVE